MSLHRSDSANTMFSRAWSTNELSAGLEHILLDKNELPDDMAQLEELEHQLANMEAQQAAGQALDELEELQRIANPQSQPPPAIANADTLPATPEELQSAGRVVPTQNSESGNSQKGTSVCSPSSPVPSVTSLGSQKDGSVQDRIMEMWRDGSITGDLAMQLLGSGGMKPDEPGKLVKPKGSENAPDKCGEKRPANEVLPTQPEELEEVLQQAKKAKMEENALKAKLRRLCGPKANGEIGVPEWLHKQWKNGDHMSMALEFQRCGFDKEKFIKLKEKSITKNDKTTRDLNVGWYSEDDMVKVLKWNKKKIEGAIKVCMADEKHLVRKCQYGGDDEYYVRVRETGNHQQEKINSEVTKETNQDLSDTSELADVTLAHLDANQARNTAMLAARAMETSEAVRAKESFRKFVDSVLQKGAKIRTLIADLVKNYPEDDTAQKSAKALETDLQTLDTEYSTLGDWMAKGEQDDFSPEWAKQAEQKMRQSTFTCTKVQQNEAKIRANKRHFKKIDRTVKPED